MFLSSHQPHGGFIPRTHPILLESTLFCKVFSSNLIYFLNKEYFIPIEHFVNKMVLFPRFCLYCFSLSDKYPEFGTKTFPYISFFSAKTNSKILSSAVILIHFPTNQKRDAVGAHSPTASPIFSI